MRTDRTYYGDYTATDKMPFTASDIGKAVFRISANWQENVLHWPVLQEQTQGGHWQLYFVRPVTDEAYEQLEIE